MRKILCNDELRLLAIETGFCSRASKLSPEVFFDLLFYASSLTLNSSLEHLVSHLYDMHDIEICKQSLDERFTAKTVDFVKAVLSRLIRAQFSDTLISEDFCTEFNHVRIKDSTTFKAPDNLADNYSGNGGGAAGITIQYEFDLKTGAFLDLTITGASRNDQTDARETSENISENDLVLRDMGYFSISVFQKTNGEKAYFLSRLPASVLVYEEDGSELDFKKLESFMSENKIEQMEKQVLIGEKKMPVRLMIGLVPDSVYEQRIRRKKEEEKRKGHATKERTKLLLRFNLFVTNADADKLPNDKIMPLYRFRWQVELGFKFWKSLYSIHTLQKMKEARYVTMLYTRLILIVVNWQIVNRLQYLLSKQKGGMLSYHKALHTMKDKFAEVMLILREGMDEAVVILANIFCTLSKNHRREKRKNRENFIENICLFICGSEK